MSQNEFGQCRFHPAGATHPSFFHFQLAPLSWPLLTFATLCLLLIGPWLPRPPKKHAPFTLAREMEHHTVGLCESVGHLSALSLVSQVLAILARINFAIISYIPNSYFSRRWIYALELMLSVRFGSEKH